MDGASGAYAGKPETDRLEDPGIEGTIILQDRQHTHNVTFQCICIASYHFSWRVGFYHDLMSLVIIKGTLVSMQSVPYFCPILK